MITRLERSGLGPGLIDFLGHMRAPAALHTQVCGLDLPGPVGLGIGIDPTGAALPALARFGFGFVEAGTAVPTSSMDYPEAPVRLDELSALRVAEAGPYVEAKALRQGLEVAYPLACPVFVRIAASSGPHTNRSDGEQAEGEDASLESIAAVAKDLEDVADAFVVPRHHSWARHVQAVHDASNDRPVFVALRLEDATDAAPEVAGLIDAGAAGLIIEGAVLGGDPNSNHPPGSAPSARQNRILMGSPAKSPTLDAVRTLRADHGLEIPIVACGGIHAPADAIALIDAGATLVQIRSGLVFTGPGLPKRTNEALIATGYGLAADRPNTGSAAPPSEAPHPLAGLRLPAPWLGFLALGLGLILTGIGAWAVAATRVVLPYDEAFCGLSRAELAGINPRLLPFMAHDRISLAGTTIALGVQYAALATFGVRRGIHWARRATLWSAALGFPSFFLFLLYGYLDPLHFAVTTTLFAFFVYGLRSEASGPPEITTPDLHNDTAWRSALAGQLAWITLAFGLIVGGLTIGVLGSTILFVPSDLEYLGVTSDTISTTGPRVFPLIAHDRATFGGGLAASGVALLLISLWGVRRGARWVWWTILFAGPPGFLAALGVHFAVGYLDLPHLSPVLLGLALHTLGLATTRRYLLSTPLNGAPPSQ